MRLADWFRGHFDRLRAEAVTPKRQVAAATKLPDPNADLQKQLLADRAFVARDGQVYFAGPCGFVPRSAKFDPLRAKVRRRGGR